MAKEKEKQLFKVDFKPAGIKLRSTRSQLNKIKNKVIKKDQRAIAAQIRAIDVLLAACAAKKRKPVGPPMSAAYTKK